MPFIGRELAMVSPALKCHATPLPLNAAPAETGSHDASSCKLSIRSEACIQSGVFRSKAVPLTFLKCPIETSSSLSACHCISCFFYWLLIFFHQEKLAKSIHYLISKEDQVRSQITNLEGLINQTEVRLLTLGGNTCHAGPNQKQSNTLYTSLPSIG